MSEALDPFIDQATSIFADSDLASTVAGILTDLVSNVNAAPDALTAADMVRAAVPQIEQEHDIALKRNFTRLEPWTADVLAVLKALVADRCIAATPCAGGLGQPRPVTSTLAASALGNLTAIIDPLALPPSLQPANPQRLVRTIAQTFSPQADTAPRLLAAFRPAVATTIYQAWAGVETPSSQVQVYALRVKAAPYGNNAPQQATVTIGQVPTYSRVAAGDRRRRPATLSLDSTYDKIVPGSWVVVGNSGGSRANHHAGSRRASVSRSDYGMAARVTATESR